MQLKQVLLSDVCTFKQCGGTPDILNEEYWDGNLPWLSSGETSSLFVRSTEKHISEKAVTDYKLKPIPKNSLVIARSGQGHTRGQVSMCLINTYVNDGLIVILPNEEKICPYYLLYNLSSRYEEIRQLSDANSCRGNLNARILADITIALPDLRTQRIISSFLKGIDNKIALNQAINDNLLNIAQCVYNKFKSEDNTDYKKLKDVAILNGNSITNTTSFEFVNYLDTGSITNGVIDSYQYIIPGFDEIPSRAKRLVEPRDIIFSTVRPNQKHYGILSSVPKNCIVSTGFITIHPKYNWVSNEMLYLEISSDETVECMQQIAETSTSAYPSIRPDDLGNFEVPIIQNNSFKAFLKDLFEQIDVNNQENVRLNLIRECLLPKLLSGEIDISSLGESQLNNHLLAEFLLMENLCLLLKSKLIGMLDNESISIVISELSQILKECSTETNITDPNIRNNNLLNSFLSAKRLEGCSEKTISYYQSTLQMFLTDSKHDIISITTDHIRNYLSEYQSERKSSKVTIDNIRRIFSSFFSWLEDEEYILKSPVRRIHKVKFGRTVKETFTDEELEKMRDSCNNIRNLSILDTFISTGMRVGELVKLNITDVDFDGRECIVFGKGDCERRVYFDARTKLHLQSYLEHRSDTNPALFVTQNKPTKRISINGVESMLKVLGNNIGLTDIHPHKFRRTMATRAIDKGMPIEQVQKLLGHVRIDTTLHYAMVNQENVKNAHKKYVA